MGYFDGIITLTLSAVLISTVLMATLKNTSTTGWSAAEVSMWGLIGLVSIFGLVYGAMRMFGMIA